MFFLLKEAPVFVGSPLGASWGLLAELASTGCTLRTLEYFKRDSEKNTHFQFLTHSRFKCEWSLLSKSDSAQKQKTGILKILVYTWRTQTPLNRLFSFIVNCKISLPIK